MNAIPLVSVLLVTYNHENYIAQALDSILMQQCSFDFEIIVGEDCSTDKTREICRDYQAKYPDRIVLCLNDKNKGLLDNYFDIFLKCRGKYIADCGGDDYWLTPHKLQHQVDLLNQYPNVSLVASNWLMFKQKTGVMETGTSSVAADWYRPECFGKGAVSSYLNESVIPRVVLASSCFRKDMIFESYFQNPAFFKQEGFTCEDMSITLALLMKGPFYFQRETYMVYRVLEKSLSHALTNDEYMKGFAFKTYQQVITQALKLGLKPSDIDGYVHRWAGSFAMHAFLTGNHRLYFDLKSFLEDKKIPLKLKHRLRRLVMFIPGLYPLVKGWYGSLKNPVFE